jgi:acyl-CoA thioesterase-1
MIAPLRDNRFAGAKRVGRVLLLAFALVASLLTFPGGIVSMTACWLAAYTIAALLGRKSAWLLALWGIIVLVKRIDWPASLWALTAVSGATVVITSLRWKPSARTRFVLLMLVWIAWIAYAAESYRAVHINHAPAAIDGRPIVCVGDSLTSYTRQGGYHEVLAEMVDLPVINLGEPGITSTDALKKLPELKAAGPGVVVIELGGNDFARDASVLKTASRATVKRNLEAFIECAADLQAEVILIEVPRGFVVDPYAGLERELARRYDLELISDTTIRRFVLSSPVAPPGSWQGGPYLSDDGLHPNALGNAVLARRVSAALARIYEHESLWGK